MSEGIFFLAMPAARAIHFKSGFAPTYTLRAFRFYPYCICQHSRNTHCQAAHPALPVAIGTKKISMKIVFFESLLIAIGAKKLSMKIPVSPSR